MIRLGLIGARGYVGRELIGAIDTDDQFDLLYASSRALAGRALGSSPGLSGLSRFGELMAEDIGPDEASERPVDVVVLGLPNGMSGPFVDALERRQPETLIIDLGADHRYKDGWVYGSPELNGKALPGAKRIANPGCYATAANLALMPLKDLAAGPASVFGVSGFSGAGTTPGSRNDAERLESNVIPYGFGGHGHQSEVESTTGMEVVFAPHVAPFFRGLLTTITVPLDDVYTAAAIRARFNAFYEPYKSVQITEEPPEITMVAGADGCFVGGFAVDKAKPCLTLTSGLDNLRKGAATQAIENIRLALVKPSQSR
ncbi:MAG: Asd/ArgC dimerization domain-containing protein [Pseudomonadota bacterium]